MIEPARLVYISQLIGFLHHYWSQYPNMRLGEIISGAALLAGKDCFDLTDTEMRNMVEQMWLEQIGGGFDGK